MKNIFLSVITLITAALTLVGCNYSGYDWIDNNYHFDKAIIAMPDESIVEGKIKQWTDAEGEQLTITLDDGNRYLVSSINCVLIEEDID